MANNTKFQILTSIAELQYKEDSNRSPKRKQSSLLEENNQFSLLEKNKQLQCENEEQLKKIAKLEDQKIRGSKFKMIHAIERFEKILSDEADQLQILLNTKLKQINDIKKIKKNAEDTEELNYLVILIKGLQNIEE